MLYRLKYKRKGQWFWRAFNGVKGHNLNGNTLDVFFVDGIRTIHSWDQCDMKLGSDFMLFQKEQMEKESGLNIKVNKD